jgi:hypothetical protein
LQINGHIISMSTRLWKHVYCLPKYASTIIYHRTATTPVEMEALIPEIMVIMYVCICVCVCVCVWARVYIRIYIYIYIYIYRERERERAREREYIVFPYLLPAAFAIV